MTEEKEIPQHKSVVMAGDVIVASSEKSLKECSSELKELLKDKSVKNYLNVKLIKKKMLGIN